MAKHSSKHPDAIQPAKRGGAPPTVPAVPGPAADPPPAGEGQHWGYGVLLVVWMAGFFGLLIQVAIEFVMGLFRR